MVNSMLKDRISRQVEPCLAGGISQEADVSGSLLSN
jgi:hypothetical protein